MKKLNQKELSTNAATSEHIRQVAKYIHIMIKELLIRTEQHDKTKLEPPEVEIFAEETPKLAKLEYGSKEYKEELKVLEEALKHHYAKNRHHPEHFPNGVSGMNLIDLVEMLCDWKAATYRHETGNILSSLEINTKRFEIDSQLAQILKNTIEYFDMLK